MRKIALTIATLIVAGGAAIAQQSKEFSLSSPSDVFSASGGSVTVNVTYTLPADDPLVQAGERNEKMKPARVIWYWGDDAPGAKVRTYNERAYVAGERVTHTYKAAGKYGIFVIVLDAKNRSIRQAGITIRIQNPVTIEPADGRPRQE